MISKIKSNSGGYVYLMHALGTNRYKIGFVRKHPIIRQKQLNQKQNAYEIAIVTFIYIQDFVKIEGQLKKKYLKYKVRNEWFEFTPSILLKVINDFVEGSATKIKPPKLALPRKRNQILAKRKTP